MRKCPYCAESIQDAAIKCRFCQSNLSAPTSDSSALAHVPASASISREVESIPRAKQSFVITFVMGALTLPFEILGALWTWHREGAATRSYGKRNPQLVCPHCTTRGEVRTLKVTRKKGVSGGKATAAVLTAGVSLLLTGLSRKEMMTAARCDHCRSTWDF